MIRDVIFDGSLTLTHHATNNNLPGGQNITTAVNDRASYIGDGTTVYCVNYQKADGTAVSSPAAPTIQVFTSSGTWTKPTNCKKIKVTVTGGGGGGHNYGATGQGSSGGAGGTAIKIIDVTGVSSVAVTIGAGGAAKVGAGNGNAGATSSFGFTVPQPEAAAARQLAEPEVRHQEETLTLLAAMARVLSSTATAMSEQVAHHFGVVEDAPPLDLHTVRAEAATYRRLIAMLVRLVSVS